MWNSLDVSVRSVDSVNQFKSRLDKVYSKSKANQYYYYGNRRMNSLLSSIRTKCSQLKHDLFSNDIIDNDLCTCGLSETAYHYFFECVNYIVQRDRLYNDTFFIQNLTLSTILHGNSEYSLQQNSNLFEAISLYITTTNRFSNSDY